MNEQYTPTADEMRHVWLVWRAKQPQGDGAIKAEFDRWLDGVKAEAETRRARCVCGGGLACADVARRTAAERDDLGRRLADLIANPRDEHHTMAELYEYRMLYNAHAAHGWLAAGIPVVKSWRHHDGAESFGGGWFIVVAQLPTGQVSNHYAAEHWALFDVPEVALPPEYDGHTPADAADRLDAMLRAGAEQAGGDRG